MARSSGGDQRMLARETAEAIAGLNLDPAGLVVVCRRIVERHPTSGVLWWLCSTLLASANPFREAWALADFIEEDPTPNLLVRDLPDDATVCVVGWPDLVGEALIRRGDINALVIDSNAEGSRLVRRLQRLDVDVEAISAEGIGAAVAASDLVIVEATATSQDGGLCALGSHAAAAVAYCNETPVWMVAGRGRRLPDGLWSAMIARLDAAGPAWEQIVEPVALGLMTAVLGADGLVEPCAESLRAECPMAHELLRSSAM